MVEVKLLAEWWLSDAVLLKRLDNMEGFDVGFVLEAVGM